MNSQSNKSWMSLRFFLVVTVLIAIPIGIYFVNRINSGGKRLVGQLFSKSQLVSIDDIDHDVWDDLVQQYVDEEGNVDYQSWSENRRARTQLEKYFRNLSSADPDMAASKTNQLAYWINAYNALTIHGILEEYPTDSIRNHTSLVGGYNIWFDLKLIVSRKELSLDHIEHEILRKMNEPRIHFAIVCAAKSCPRLLNRAYSGKELESQLNANAIHFFSRTGNIRIEESENTIYLSSIFKWFGKDFGESDEEIIASITPYLAEEMSALVDTTMRIRFLAYDWGLNESPR